MDEEDDVELREWLEAQIAERKHEIRVAQAEALRFEESDLWISFRASSEARMTAAEASVNRIVAEVQDLAVPAPPPDFPVIEPPPPPPENVDSECRQTLETIVAAVASTAGIAIAARVPRERNDDEELRSASAFVIQTAWKRRDISTAVREAREKRWYRDLLTVETEPIVLTSVDETVDY